MSNPSPTPPGAATASEVSAVDPRQLPVRVVDGEFFRHTAPKRAPLAVPHTARASGRYHRKGQQPRLYASSTRDTAWGELFRHTEPEVSPFEVRRRMSKLRVSALPVLDLTDAGVQGQLGITKRNLIRNRPAVCRRIADLARQAPDRFGGLLAPSAADPSEHTLVGSVNGFQITSKSRTHASARLR